MEEISVGEAVELDKIERRLIKEFKEQIQLDEKYEVIKQKSFSPVTNALEKIEDRIEHVLNEIMKL